MKTLKEVDVKNKRVLMRCDFNVPLNFDSFDNPEITDDFRIKATIPTIKYLLSRKAKVILMSHLDKPEGRIKENLRMTPIQKKLKEFLNISVIKASDCVGQEVEKQSQEMEKGEILLLENLRFHKEEKENDKSFAKALSRLADFYINDAFGVCHRAHASVVGVPRYLPSAAGFLVEKEVKILSKVLEKPWRPLVVIIGGAKIESKIKVIKKFAEQADHLLIGGKIANTILKAKGILVGRPLPPKEIIEEIEKFDLTSTKLHLPIDSLVSPDKTGKLYIRESAPAKVRKDEKLLDIGPETIKMFAKIIKEAKMIVWSGPVGYFEEPNFERGTKEIAEKIVRNYRAFKIAGGGDTISALAKFDLRDKFDHISTGGGAMLSFLGGEKLPGLEALKK